MLCKNCSSEMSGSAIFCGICGNGLEKSEISSDGGASCENYPSKQNNLKKRIFVFFAGVLVSVGLYFGFTEFLVYIDSAGQDVRDIEIGLDFPLQEEGQPADDSAEHNGSTALIDSVDMVSDYPWYEGNLAGTTWYVARRGGGDWSVRSLTFTDELNWVKHFLDSTDDVPSRGTYYVSEDGIISIFGDWHHMATPSRRAERIGDRTLFDPRWYPAGSSPPPVLYESRDTAIFFANLKD